MITWGTLMVFLAGIIFFAGIKYVMLPRAKSSKAWVTVVNWVLYFVVYLDLAVGISFMYINMQVGHVKATSTAVFVFIGSAVVLGIVLARLLGFLGGKKVTPANENQSLKGAA